MRRRIPSAIILAVVLNLQTAGAWSQDTPPPGNTAPPAASPVPTPAPTPPTAPTSPPEAASEATTQPASVPDPTPSPIDGLEATVTSSGLKYYDLKIGEGEQPRSGAEVSVHYSGWLTNGTLFDSSVKKNEPLRFHTNRGVIQGWIEGIATMRVGGKRRLEIPSDLAYGQRGRGSTISPDSDLIFEIELLAIEQQGPAQSSTDGVEPATTESGVTYWDLAPGTGPSPGKDGRVAMDFAVWHTNGTFLGGSVTTDNPFRGPLSNVVPGWADGVSTMKQGGKRRLLVPAALAYGERGTRAVPPNSDLVIEVNLREVLEPLVQAPIDGIEAIVTDSGVHCWDIQVGEGATAEADSTCRIHYTGWLTDGTLIQSSKDVGQPLTIALGSGRVPVKGWLDGIKTMKVGGKRRLEIPSELAFGEQGLPPNIPPNAPLIFEIELLEVN